MKKHSGLGNRGEGAPQFAFFAIVAAAVISLFLMVAPAFLQKQQLDTYAGELCRTAAIAGRVGSETDERSAQLHEQTGLSPEITWSSTGNVQIGQTIAVTLQSTYNMRFGSFGNYPISMVSKASGKSEVYWK